MSELDAQALSYQIFGMQSDKDTQQVIEEFLALRDLKTAHELADKLRGIRHERDQIEHRHGTSPYWTKLGEINAFNIAIREIDPRNPLIAEHKWDETVFGAFFCTKCTPGDGFEDDNVAWPCPPLRAVGVTHEDAVRIITAHRERIAAEHARKKAAEGS